jgi:hypothetical protein
MIEPAINNARWCDAVCRAQGLPTRFSDAVWVSLRRSPPFYPDAVTLAPSVTPGEVLRDIDTSPGCSVKDSFATLDLAPHGFEVLFDAEWIHRPAAPGPGEPVWRTTTDFGRWETGHLFRPALLDDADISFLAGPTGAVIANVTGPVVGLSNLVATGEADQAWADAVRSVAAWHPALPMVGYERGDDLAAAHRAGFTSAGPLRIWIKPDADG